MNQHLSSIRLSLFYQWCYHGASVFMRRYCFFTGFLFISLYCLVKLPGWANMPVITKSLVGKVEIVHTNDLNRIPEMTNFRRYMYVRSAFRVSDKEIRLSVVKSHYNSLPLYYTYGSRKGQVNLVCHLPKCPDAFSPPCDLNGYIGIIKNLSSNDKDHHIFLYSIVSNLTSRITITDVRPKMDGLFHSSQNYPHKLGVCLQPIYLMTDYTLLIQFFEYWLQEGATKFYIYWESFSEEIQDILKFYIATSGADIELINWSRLPTTSDENATLETNPNAYWFRLEVFLGIFDCIHRSRYNAKFIAQSDLDEMFYVKNKTLLEYLEKMNKKHPNMVDVQFLSKRVHMNTSISDITHPSEFPFDDFKMLDVDKFPFKKPLYTKMIHRPERDFHVHIHRSQTPEEIIPGSEKYYEHITATSSEAAVWHFRRLKDHYKHHKTENTSTLEGTVNIWKANFNKRIESGNLPERERWINRGTSFGKELDKCRQKQSNERDKVCHNLLACELKIKSVRPEEWIRASNSWHLV